MPFWRKKARFTDQQMVFHVLPWLSFTGLVDSRGEGAEVTDEEIKAAWLDCIKHYGLETAESMNSRMVDAVATASNELEKKMNLGRLLPPVETCPICVPATQ